MNKKKWDKEYSTQYLKEVDFLTSKGIKWSFVKTIDGDIRVYKYKKNKELFIALSGFYNK